MTTFLDILPEIVSGNILPLLSQNDLLRLRRVCKQTKASAEDYISLKGLPKPPEFEIHDGPSENSNPSERKYTLAEYIEAEPFPFPSTHFFFNLEHYHGQLLAEFMKQNGPNISHARVNSFKFPELWSHYAFHGCMENVIHLTIDEVDPTFPGLTPVALRLPKLTHLTVKRDNAWDIREASMIWDMFMHSPKLESFNYPMYPNFEGSKEEGGPGALFTNVVKKSLIEANKGNFSTLKTIDLRHYQTPDNAFLVLCDLAFKNGVHLHNVNPALLRVLRMLYDDVGRPPIAYSIRSLSGCIQWDMFFKCPVYLRKVEFGRNTSMLSFSALLLGFCETVPTEVAEWPRLAEVDCLVDTGLPHNKKDWHALFDHLFGDKWNREKLTELKLEFKQTPAKPIVPKIHIPKVENITKNCYNIKCLTLIGWPGKNKQLIQLWQGLLHLENVTLENIPNLGNVAFVGESVDDPVFLKLKMLRCLRLRGLNKIPKITDTAFHLVIQHLALTEFEMEASEPLSTVTTRGIRELLKGKFADTIERFSFKNWALKDVSADDFKALKMEFRSSQMI